MTAEPQSTHERDEGAAMLIAIFMILTVAALSTLLAAMVIGQVAPTKQVAARVEAVRIADAGIEAALSEVRTAPSANGLSWNLPCYPSTRPLHGNLGHGDSEAFTVTLVYYTAEGQPATCAGKAARYVDLTSEGAVTGSGTPAVQRRVLHQRYYLNVTDKHVLGGLVRSLQDQSKCVQIAGATPGSPATLATCNDSDPTQRFAYNKDYTLAVTNVASLGSQCLTAGDDHVVKTAACSNDIVQKWGYGAQPDFYLTNPYRCLATADGSQNVGTSLVVKDGCDPNYGRVAFGWAPDPAIGPGSIAADESDDLHDQNLQWINYQEFGRCIDVTNEDVNAGFLINYPCKQDPSRPSPRWNQLFRWNADGGLETTAPSKPDHPYCITSSPTVGRVTLTRCDRSAAQRWTVTRASNPFDRYTVVDAWGRCLAANDKDLFNGAFSIEATATCDGSARQKWNAPGLRQEGGLRDLRETDPNS